MRSDYQTLREILSGFADPDQPSSTDGLAGQRRARALEGQGLSLPEPGPHPRDLRQTLVQRSSTTSYGPEPLDAAPLLGMVRQALIEDQTTWGRQADLVALEPFVLLLRPRGAEPGIYRVGRDGAELLRPLPTYEQIEGMAVQKEFARAGAIVSVAADLDGADSWAGAHGYRFAMMRSASLIYSVHLRATAHSLVGTVFAGFSTSMVRHLLDSDGVSRHQMFAVTVAAPQSAEPAEPAEQAGPAEPSGEIPSTDDPP